MYNLQYLDDPREFWQSGQTPLVNQPAPISVSNTSTGQVINANFETIAAPNSGASVQYVEQSVVGTTLPQYVAAEVTPTGLITPSVQSLTSGQNFSPMSATGFTPDESQRLITDAGETLDLSGAEKRTVTAYEKLLASVKVNKVWIGGGALVLAIGWFSARSA